MADFALWATACETAIWDAGTFWSAYCGNRDEAVESVIDADPIATAVRALMEPRTERTVRTQTASDLLGALAEKAGERVAKAKTWPDNARALGGRLRRAAPLLRKIGIEIDFVREGRARTRTIVITAEAGKDGKFTSASSAPSAAVPKSNLANGFAAPNPRTQTDDADATRLVADGSGTGGASTVRANPFKTAIADDADGTAAEFTTQSSQAGGVTPFLMTHDMHRRLRELGNGNEAIRALMPVDALRLLDAAKADDNPIDDLMPGAEVTL